MKATQINSEFALISYEKLFLLIAPKYAETPCNSAAIIVNEKAPNQEATILGKNRFAPLNHVKLSFPYSILATTVT
jgi:hypothetical protein